MVVKCITSEAGQKCLPKFVAISWVVIKTHEKKNTSKYINDCNSSSDFVAIELS